MLSKRTGDRRAWRVAAALVVAAGAGHAHGDEAGGNPPPAASPAPGGDGAGEPTLEPLLPTPLLLEKALRSLLDSATGRDTLDDVMNRVAARRRAAEEAAQAAQRRQFIREQAQQFEQMLQPLLRVELEFVRRCCASLPPAARGEVLAAARQAVRELAERVARLQFEGEGDTASFDMRRALHEKVAAAVEPRAAREEFVAYERESRLRHERRAEAARIRIVAKLDEQLGLTAAQRSELLEELRSRWQAEWIRELEEHDGVMINELPPAPEFAAALIVPLLDPIQRAQWTRWSEEAGWDAFPRGRVDWSDLNALQQGPQELDPWWRP